MSVAPGLSSVSRSRLPRSSGADPRVRRNGLVLCHETIDHEFLRHRLPAGECVFGRSIAGLVHLCMGQMAVCTRISSPVSAGSEDRISATSRSRLSYDQLPARSRYDRTLPGDVLRKWLGSPHRPNTAATLLAVDTHV